MPNHFHLLIAFLNTNRNLNKLVGDIKRFIGYGIVKRLQEYRRDELLQQLSEAVIDSDRRGGKLYEVWKKSSDWKVCDSTKMIVRKSGPCFTLFESENYSLISCYNFLQSQICTCLK